MGAPPAEDIVLEEEADAEPAQAGGLMSTLRTTPGWVWIVIGGVVLLVVGLLAARATIPGQRDFKDVQI